MTGEAYASSLLWIQAQKEQEFKEGGNENEEFYDSRAREKKNRLFIGR